MRSRLCSELLKKVQDPEFVFVTGDLGFMVLEPLREALGERFINAGIAEQTMVSMSAGMAKVGLKPWIYSIGPFLYARPYEQIRNDLCMHDLPVRMIGNGGGYAYGAMGFTHHALEDYGSLLCLPNMHVFIPAFSDDLVDMVDCIDKIPHPVYIRLGRCEKPEGACLPEYSPWRRLLEGSGPTLVIVGPIVGGILKILQSNTLNDLPDLWVLSELPIKSDEIPEAFLESIQRSKDLIVVEEHYAHGSVGQGLTYMLCNMGQAPLNFTHRHAKGYITGYYGSQDFHRRESCLDSHSIFSLLKGYQRNERNQ